jgi:surface antigen
MTKKFQLTIIAMALTMGVVMISGAAPVSAAPGRAIAAPDLNIRADASGASALIGHIPYGVTVDIPCTRIGTTVVGPYGATSIWDKVTYGGVTGYVTDALMFTNSAAAVAPPCGTSSPALQSSPVCIQNCGVATVPNVTAPIASTPGRTWGQTRSWNAGYPSQCTWGAMEQVKAASGVYPAISGNAKDWAASARAAGWTVVADAEPRSVVVFQPGVQGADRTYGHVAYSESVERRSDGLYVHILEMNGTAGAGNWDRRVVRDLVGMSYVLIP